MNLIKTSSMILDEASPCYEGCPNCGDTDSQHGENATISSEVATETSQSADNDLK